MIAKNNCQNKTLTILCQTQFGSHVATYFYCKYLRFSYNITQICWDYSQPKQILNNVNCIYVSRNGNIITRNYRYLSAAHTWLKNNDCQICFIKYFRGCSLLRLLHPEITFVFDIRTGSISHNNLLRKLYDSLMMLESRAFKHVTVISQSLALKLKITRKAYVLPLGSEAISRKKRTFDSLHLLYVGTLSGRDIHKTLIAFADFYHEHKNINMSYTIIGDGPGGEVEHLKAIAKERAISNIVDITGRIPFTQLKPYFDAHNLGISFVPITDYFDSQPVTKTFDYLLSGMPVIATATAENKQVINDKNGLLIDDSILGFYNDLRYMLNNKHNYNSENIIRTSSHYNWENIVNNLGTYFESLPSAH